ncbi:hypothetical protein [Garciella nitratireducens]|uniref:Acetolactate synthase small subunit-like ACT domain-containing protein n=1 Tax=Garciella nitratireducens DSM 15102 TaxID=1121911 RepID=A0A1T4LHU7_9FIRM|nr:hypothetical protein [Garciella nitratireducens]SJZ54283.1 hypothetical protein SAMN02745973_00971 [Garciella nitratireducens DSM 15102]
MEKKLLALVNNEPEVLIRITELLRRKGIKIKNISMNQIENTNWASLTIVFFLENEHKMMNIYYSIKKMENVIQLEKIKNEEIQNQFQFLEKAIL